MAILSGPQNAGIPGYAQIKPPRPVVGPQNVGLPGYRPGDPGNPTGALAPGPAAPAPLQAPPAAAPPPPPPPPVDYWSLARSDPQFTRGDADLQAANTAAQAALLHGFRQNSQSYQDNANAHNALFSGAAVNAQRTAAQNFANQSAAQARSLQSGENTLQSAVFQRLLQGLAGGGA